jgi:hypothetical protein
MRVRIRIEGPALVLAKAPVLADGTLFWVVFADSERVSQVARLPWVPRPACAFGAKSPEDGYLSSSVTKSRQCFATNQLPVIDGQPDSARISPDVTSHQDT